MKKILSKKSKDTIITLGIVVVAFIVVEILRAAGALSSSLEGQLVPICAYIVMAVSLNLTVGILGELSLGHAGFMSIGAFSGVVAASMLGSSGMPSGLVLVISMIIGGIIAGVFSLLVCVPVLRLRGDYLAIVTLAFGEIVKNIVNCLYVGIDAAGLHICIGNADKLGMDPAGTMVLNGPMGAVGVTKHSTFLAGFIFVLVVLFVVLNLINSRSGRAIMALRDNRIAAESIGISITKYKLMAFIVSAVFAGMAGVLFALNYSTVAAKKFDFNTSILVLVFVVLGGIGNIRGSVIAATILTILPELLREFSDYRMLVYAIVLILVMIGTNSEGAKRVIAKVKDKIRSKKAKKGDVNNG